MSDFTIRPLASADIEQIKKLHATLVPVNYPASFFLHLLIQNSYSCLIALEPSSGEPVAWVSASLHKSSNLIGSLEPHIQLLTLGVLPEYQHRGLAKRLVWEVIASLHKDPSTPVPTVYTHVCTSNTPAQAFYESIGMKFLPAPNSPSGKPYVAKNVYTYPPLWAQKSVVGNNDLFESKDAYVLVGKITA
ncbi:acyl-CoA N-acyltransferase [Lentinula edodes]|uniref:N-alpha-acetyltransferase 60 n=1 Tax=Lentinula edodes TaxID=5353 RepID=A0A1Q3DZI4_LENED|nr:acyl-CoA N-acyltransferase [Lentinula edodes]KAH7875069.1 acyl-CoA N-acyltransferase [Lentinula edodes]KAJ3898906.1 acyl-CoA N-acyltransferase [Lentinula edodes]KAJ3922247.1 acyl-CoA N-acyltransferase [Lentinula edodes]GAW00350.1 gcn5-related n-acetyltransferase family protein [Lentinula edodes]